METTTQTIDRLLSALEALACEDQFLIKNHDYEAAATIRERELPIVEKLTSLLAEPGIVKKLPAHLIQRAQSVLSTLQTTVDFITLAKAKVQAQLRELKSTQARTQKLRPAYGISHLTPVFAHEA